jgi:probable rRNA maturation factor
MIEIVNRQRKRKIDLKPLRSFASTALVAMGKDRHDATIAFVSNRQMRQLNERFRGLNKTTDVLSFPAGSETFENFSTLNLGDVAIAVEQAEQQAGANGLTLEQEISQLILHGLLHLCGYDHETDDGEMNRLELRLRRQLGI